MLILFRNKIFMEGDSGGSSGGSSGGEGSSSTGSSSTGGSSSSGGTSSGSGTGFSVTTPDGSVTSTYGSNGTVTTTNNNTGVTTTYTPNGSGGYSVSTNNGTDSSSSTSNSNSGTTSGSSSSGGSSGGSSSGSSSSGGSSGGSSGTGTSNGGNSNAPASVSESNGVSVAMANAAQASQAQVAAVSQFAAQAQAVGVAQEAAGVTAEAQAKAEAQAAKDAKVAQEANAKYAQAQEAHANAVAESESQDASFAGVIGKHYGISVEGVVHGKDGSVTAYGKDGSVSVDANGNVSVKGAASEDNSYASIVAGRYGKESQNAHEASIAARDGLLAAMNNANAANNAAKESAAKANEAKDANAKAQQALADAQASAANAGKAMADAEAAAAKANESVEGAKGTKEEALQEVVNDKAAQDVAGGDGGIGVSDAGDAGNAASVADEADGILRKGSLQDFAVQFVTADIFAGPARESCIAALQDFITHDPNSVATVTSVLRGLVDSLKSVFSDSSLSIMGKLTQGLKELGSYYQAVKGVLVESKYGKAITALGAFVRVGIGVLAIMAFPQAMLPAIGMWFAKWAFHGLKAYGRDHPGYEPEGNYAMSTWSDSESNALDKELPDLVGIRDEDFGSELKPTKYKASQTPSYAGYNNGLKDTAYSDKTVKEYITNLSRKSPVIKIVMKRIK